VEATDGVSTFAASLACFGGMDKPWHNQRRCSTHSIHHSSIKGAHCKKIFITTGGGDVFLTMGVKSSSITGSEIQSKNSRLVRVMVRLPGKYLRRYE